MGFNSLAELNRGAGEPTATGSNLFQLKETPSERQREREREREREKERETVTFSRINTPDANKLPSTSLFFSPFPLSLSLSCCLSLSLSTDAPVPSHLGARFSDTVSDTLSLRVSHTFHVFTYP